jgi:hypothetical protein
MEEGVAWMKEGAGNNVILQFTVYQSLALRHCSHLPSKITRREQG